MRLTTTLAFWVAVLCMGPGTHINAQVIWPGDVNNNGIVNGVDLLFWGGAYGSIGSPRNPSSAAWAAQPMPGPWIGQYDNGLNYAYGDANGDGIINDADMDDAIIENHGKIHGTVQDDPFPTPQGNNHPKLNILAGTSVASPGQEVIFTLELGNSQYPIEKFYGVAFTIEYFGTNLVIGNSIHYEPEVGGWTSPQGGLKHLMIADTVSGKIEMAMTRADQSNVGGYGILGKLNLFVGQLPPGAPTDTLTLKIGQIMLVDKDMQITAVTGGIAKVAIQGVSTPVYCPHVIDPVCGSNGVTYINSCYAESAGVSDYTPGVCYIGCIDPSQMNPNAICPTLYQPVCGCNGITYLNSCQAEAAGVVSYTTGPCNSSSCYDPIFVATSGGTIVDGGAGTITMNCPPTSQPVCGCNGVTYTNPCVAEANGITFYTPGPCNTNCVDPAQMNPDAICTTIYAPVCGCNGVTYINECQAQAAGVVNYTPGVCGAGSSWCNEAIPIQCGDFLAYETTVGAGNNINGYPGCVSGSFLGPDRVYVLNKTSAGDLQIGLEITTPGLNLDMFLLSGNCNQVTCLRSSTTSNTQTNNEGIVLEDAPIGTYYIVVDAKNANAQGDYRLEVACGYLYCGNAVGLTCGQPYSSNNITGNDDVSLYGCDNNIYNVENNGPEKVHYFTTTSPGQVNISLTGLSANLELFLLRSCDRGDCITFSQNDGNASEQISTYLPAGTYYIVVDGYNGATSNYNLTVNCASSCNFHLTSVTSTPTACGQSNGTITLTSAGGTPSYLVYFNGPVSGSFTTNSNTCTIYNLPAGTYTITKIDYNGCSDTEVVTVGSNGNLNFTLTPNNATCGMAGSIHVVISNGTGPYTVYVSGPVSTTVTTSSSNFNITNLPPGNYTVHITSASGCSASKQTTVGQSGGNFYFVGTPNGAACGQSGSIHIVTHYGVAPYTIYVSGPVSGSAVTSSSTFNIINLPAGTYTITIEDGNWCSHTEVITVPGGSINVTATPNSGVCGQYGSITVSITNGSPAYNIVWTGPVSGSTTTNNSTYVISNLPSGTYNISVEDGNWCSAYKTVTINNSGGNLSIYCAPVPGSCAQPGGINIDINNGYGPYVVTWSGPTSGSITTSSQWVNIPNLPTGSYNIDVTDYHGCTNWCTSYVTNNNTLDVWASVNNGLCGQYGSVTVSISGGSPTYHIQWSGPVNGSANTNNATYTINNLPSGTYTITVTDAHGCTDYVVKQVNNAGGSISLYASTTAATCNQGGGIWIDINGGVGPWVVTWTGPTPGTTTVNTPWAGISNLAPGTYVVTVTDVNGCSGTKTVVVGNQGGNIYVTLVGHNIVCGQSYGYINVNFSGGSAPYTVAWTGPQSGSANTNNTSYTIGNLPAGTYTVTVTSANGCYGSNTVTITATGNLNIVASAEPGNCGQSGAIWVSFFNGTAPYNVSWTGPVNGSTTTVAAGYNIPNLPGGTYTVVVTDANGCSKSKVVNLVNAESDLELVPTLTPANCNQGGAIWLDILHGFPSYHITWTGPQSGSITTGANGYNIYNLPAGTYTVTVTDGNGCTDTIVVTILLNCCTIDITGVPTNGLCGQYGSVHIGITGGTPTFTINWTGPVSGSATTSNYFYNINNLPSGTYTITVTDANGCTDTITVTVNNSQGNVDVVASLIYNQCGQYNTIWVDIIGGNGPYVIMWTGPSSGTVTIPGQAYEIMDLPPGTYWIKVTDVNGCMDTQEVIVYPAPINLFNVNVTGLCTPYGTINVNITGGTPNYTLTWTGLVSGSATISGTTYSIPNLPSGVYTLILTDANGCTETETVTVIVSSPVDVIASLIYNVCGQYNTIWVDIVGGTGPYVIMWTGPSSGTVTIPGQAYEIMDLPPGTYWIKVTDVNGCMDTQEVIVYPAPINLFTATANNGLCGSSGSIGISISGGTPNYSLSWSGPVSGSATVGGNSYTINNLPSGTYTIILIDANGCAETETVTLTNGQNPVDITVTPIPGVCGQYGSLWVDINGGVAPYIITWTGPVSGSTTINVNGYSIPNLPAGTYTVTVTDAHGCSDTVTVVLTGGGGGIEITGVPNNGTCDSGGSIHIGITGGTPDFMVMWSGPVSGMEITSNYFYNIDNLPSGTYTIIVKDANLCTDTITVTINNSGGGLMVSIMPTYGGCGQLSAIWIDFLNGTPPYTVTWQGPVSGSQVVNAPFYDITDLPGGEYKVTVTDINGCMFMQWVTVVTVVDNLSVALNAVNGGCGMQGSVQVNISGGTAPFTLTWSSQNASGAFVTSNNNYTINGLPTGIYNINVTDVNGCIELQSAQILNSPTSLSVQTTPMSATCQQPGAIMLTIGGGSPAYNISWSGAESGAASTGGTSYLIGDLSPGDYVITITDSGNCSAVRSAHVNGSTSAPVAAFSAATNMFTASFTNVSDQGTYSWNFGDGGTSTGVSPMHTYVAPGTYQVCLTVTNNCGTDTECHTVTIQMPQDVVILDIGEVSGTAGSVVQVPVTIQNCSLLVSLAGSVQVDDPLIADIVGVTAGAILPQFSPVNNTFNYYDNTGQGIPLTNGQILFYLSVQLTGSPGDMTGLSLINTPLAVEVGSIVAGIPTTLPYLTLDGEVTISLTGNVLGSVTTFWDEGIANALVTATGSQMTTSEMTNTDGNYSLPDLPAGYMYTISAAKDSMPENGLSTYGLFIGQRFILGLHPPQIYSPYQIIAGDANCNGAFTTLDLFIIQQLIIGVTDHFQQCPSWVFVADGSSMPTDFNAYNVFPYANEGHLMVMHDTIADFIGVKVGDILGDANPNFLVGNDDIDERGSGTLHLVAPNQSVKAGEYVEIPVRGQDFDDMVSYQMGLWFDTHQLQYDGFNPADADLLSSVVAGAKEADSGHLRISWFSLDGDGHSADKDQVLFTLRFKALSNLDRIEGLLAVRSEDMHTEAHNASAQQLDIELAFSQTVTGPAAENVGYKLYQNTPNPFANRTSIGFDLPADMDADLTVYDQLGRTVRHITGSYFKGRNYIELTTDELAGGVYRYTLRAKDFSDTKNMVILR